MISVIIPCYNAEKFVLGSISSILNQSYADLEVLAINDCSTDNTLEILKSINDPRLQVHTNAKNLGYLKTVNKLLTLASGDFIAFQDADDISHSDRLNLQLQYMISNPTISILGTNFSMIDNRGRVIRKSNVEERDSKLKQVLREGNPFQKPSIMFRKEVYERIGGYREEFLIFKNISEDYDWILRASHFFNFGNVNASEPLYCYRSVKTSMTKQFGHIDQLFGHQVAQFLFNERLAYGVDSVDKGDILNVMKFIDELRKPYIDDPSRFYNEKAESSIYFGLQWEAVLYSWAALRTKPSIQNLRLIQHCLRKWIIGI
jgi:glycosyltransferase involved in cell wall biosynthesis